MQPLIEDAVARVRGWIVRARQMESQADRQSARRLSGVVGDPAGLRFTMRLVDRVIRPEDATVAARQLARLVRDEQLPRFLSWHDRLLLWGGARLGSILPKVVMSLAQRRVQSLVGHLVADADPVELARFLNARGDLGFKLNVNLLGEAVLGDAEARHRHDEILRLLEEPFVDYVSVKVSAIVSQLNHWDFDGCLEHVSEKLAPLLLAAARQSPPVFVNLDMEEYHDLELTTAVFKRVLETPELHHTDAGIVLQAYLPDSFPALQELVKWANQRRKRTVHGQTGGSIKIRLVKGANLAMERVEAAMRGWEQAPYATKAETDANYKRCLDWMLHSERMMAARVGVASHNLFDMAFAQVLAEQRGVADRVEFEMLQGMAPAFAQIIREDSDGLLQYVPVVAASGFDVAISYLFRRLEENAAKENFIGSLFDLEAHGPGFEAEAAKFAAAVRDRWTVSSGPRRTQNRLASTPASSSAGLLAGGDYVSSPDIDGGPFTNEPDTDPALDPNRDWAQSIIESGAAPPRAPVTSACSAVDDIVATAAQAQPEWAALPASTRGAVLHRVAERLSDRRGDLVAAMVHEANKVISQADPEVSEAIDFARYYGQAALGLDPKAATWSFHPLGVVAVVPPWNFPVAIPAGGVLAALAAGNAVILKPAPETPRCAEIVAECCWEAGVPPAVLLFLRVLDDEAGQHLISHRDVDGVILTGGLDTAARFRSWAPDTKLFAETSGKNAMVITPHADIDLAVADLVSSAFGHSGQKCSAASLAICVGKVYESPRFRSQLVDAVSSLRVGPATELSSVVGPVIAEPTGKLRRALNQLEDQERWLVEPRQLAPAIWSPGVRADVAPGSWFHHTECFGPVLGLMPARDLDEAIKIQNATPYGLTGGIHTLDPSEVEHWLESVEIGNAYVNRPTTGAIVQRQPFGGWKQSSVGPGAKAGGPNYVAQLGVWHDVADPDDTWLAQAIESDAVAWAEHFSVEHDPSGLFCEANIFRYRPIKRIAARVESGVHEQQVRRVLAAAERCGVPVELSRKTTETPAEFAARLPNLGVERVRLIGDCPGEIRTAAHAANIHVVDNPITGNGRVELLHYLKEQSISQTLHRYGNLV